MASNGLPAAASETVDDLVYETQTPSPAKYLAFGSTEKDENGNVTAVPEYIPKPIVFESLLDERAERKRKLAAGFRVFGKFGWGFGVNGHLTARDPIKTDCFWINPWGLVGPSYSMKTGGLN